MIELIVKDYINDTLFTDNGEYTAFPDDGYVAENKTAECFYVESSETDINGKLVKLWISAM